MMSTASTTDLPTGSTGDLVEQALRLPKRLDLALVLPLGGSTFRAKLVNGQGNAVDEVTVRFPSRRWESLTAAVAAAMIHFGVRVAVGVGSIAGPIPDHGLLEFTNLQWPAFDRLEMLHVFGLDIHWLNDGAMGYYGLPLLHPSDQFAIIQDGIYRPG
jgi:predicted NBD/HSP70 family sugar kinase